MLHREQAELGAVRHPGLGVDVLDVAAGRLGRDHQLPGDWLPLLNNSDLSLEKEPVLVLEE